jgi:hypothetical protein
MTTNCMADCASEITLRCADAFPDDPVIANNVATPPPAATVNPPQALPSMGGAPDIVKGLDYSPLAK